MAVNKVVYNGQTLIDTTSVTVSEDTLLKDVTAIDKSGSVITGTYEGGGGGISIGTDTNLNLDQMFYCLSNGTAKTDEFKLTQAIPNSETLIFSTGLDSIRGLYIYDAEQTSVDATSIQVTNLAICLFDESGESVYYIRINTSFNIAKSGTTNYTVDNGLLACATCRVDGGDFYATGRYNRNANYTAFKANHTYRWIAW